MSWGDLIRGVVEGAGLVRDLVQAGRDPVREIRRIRVAEHLRSTEEAWRRELDARFPEEPVPQTQPSERTDIYDGLDS